MTHRNGRYGIAPLSAQRFLDLFTVGGKDDFFSTDTPPADRRSQLQHMSTAGQHALAAAAAAADADGGGAAVNGGVLHAGFTAVLMLSGSDEYAPLASSAATGGGESGCVHSVWGSTGSSVRRGRGLQSD